MQASFFFRSVDFHGGIATNPVSRYTGYEALGFVMRPLIRRLLWLWESWREAMSNRDLYSIAVPKAITTAL